MVERMTEQQTRELHRPPRLFPTAVVGSLPRPLFSKELFDECREACSELRDVAVAARTPREEHG
jgi:hypothetical protein